MVGNPVVVKLEEIKRLRDKYVSLMAHDGVSYSPLEVQVHREVCKEAMGHVLEAWRDLQPLLDPYRTVAASPMFEALDGLAIHMGPRTLDRAINLVKLIVEGDK